jgi:hypothetical protein
MRVVDFHSPTVYAFESPQRHYMVEFVLMQMIHGIFP